LADKAMNLREPIENINEQLLKEYGRSIDDGRPNFRVVFSEDQYEKRLTNYNDKGNELMIPEVRLLPKYKQWARKRWILERLLPITGETDLIEKITYEPLWVFQDKHMHYLPPFFDGCKFLIDNMILRISHKERYAKYKDTMCKEEYLAQVQKTQDELFGNETDIGDHLAYGSGVSLAQPSGRPRWEYE
jgi:hypothetical protein